jgi:hypothetical protein
VVLFSAGDPTSGKAPVMWRTRIRARSTGAGKARTSVVRAVENTLRDFPRWLEKRGVDCESHLIQGLVDASLNIPAGHGSIWFLTDAIEHQNGVVDLSCIPGQAES